MHNLEHGYTVAWYRADAPSDQIDALEQIAKTFSSDDYDPAKKFIAAPWTDSDGAGFPAGKNVVLTRWTPTRPTPRNQAAQKGVRQACAAVSGQAIKDFMAKYPSRTPPSPTGPDLCPSLGRVGADPHEACRARSSGERGGPVVSLTAATNGDLSAAATSGDERPAVRRSCGPAAASPGRPAP